MLLVPVERKILSLENVLTRMKKASPQINTMTFFLQSYLAPSNDSGHRGIGLDEEPQANEREEVSVYNCRLAQVEMSWTVILRRAKEDIGHNHVQDRITQEFQALV